MTRTYYEIVNDDDQPATKAQTRKLGTPQYGYASLVRAELMCPNGCAVRVRYDDGTNDWSGHVVALRTVEGRLERLFGR